MATTVDATGSSHAALHVAGMRFRHAAAFLEGDGTAPAANRWTIDIGSLSLARGEHLLLTGSSGSGKSTLLQVIAGLLDPSEGRVEIHGTPIHSLRGAARDRFRGRHVGMIFQTFNLLHGFSALENVMAALMFSEVPTREHRERAAALLSRLGITDHHRHADRMSVGQQQRVAVARAIACGPDLVLADEPTASLDPENARGAVELIREACRASGAALLCVSHDPSLHNQFERRVALHDLASQARAQGATQTGGGR